LKEAEEGVVVSSDAMVLNECVEWVNLGRAVLANTDNELNIIEL